MEGKISSIILLILVIMMSSSGCISDNDGDHDPDIFIAIHCEPGPDPNSTFYQEDKWPHLVDLVRSADDHGHKLTILMNPQWAVYILDSPVRSDLLRNWEENGHEIGLHSHGPSLNNWNGYSNQPQYRTHPKYLGTINDMMILMKSLVISGDIQSAAVTDDDQDKEYPSGIRFDLDGGWDGIDHLVSSPKEVTINGNQMVQLSHARYSDEKGELSQISISLGSIGNELDKMDEDEVMGIVFHAFDHKDRPLEYQKLFRYLDQDKDTRSRSVTEIME